MGRLIWEPAGFCSVKTSPSWVCGRWGVGVRRKEEREVVWCFPLSTRDQRRTIQMSWDEREARDLRGRKGGRMVVGRKKERGCRQKGQMCS